jgi:diguanylate cyclase (GGDEF)-like protein
VAVFDVTGLKTINDTLGHEYGDNTIKDTARILTETFGRDNTYRIGGDEFVAAVRFATSSDMKNSFKKIESLLAEINKHGGQYKIMPLVVSGGYAEFDPETDREFQDTFKRADMMMYQDKAEYYKKHDRRRR